MPPSTNGNRLYSLGPIASAISGIFRQPRNEIRSVDPDQMFGPLQPFAPLGGPKAAPWLGQIQPGQNQIYTPRARQQYSAVQLREASMYDLVRIIIENAEDQVSRLPVSVRLKRLSGESGKDYAKRKPDIGKLRMLEQRLERPNADQHRSQFIRAALEDMFTIDAASILTRRNAKGGVFDFRVIDGSQIARYFDSFGATPQPPDPAYAQIWDAGASGGTGIPWVDLTTDQLNYAVRNLKSYRLYGLSPTEQAIDMILTGDLRLVFQKAYYTDGSIPDAIQIVPTKITDDKFKEAQNVLTSELSGILTKRRNIRLIQGFTDNPKDENLIFPKEALLKDEFDDYVIRCLCYAFGTSPQRLQRVMGMRSGQVNQESAEKEGLEPWLDWATNCVWMPMLHALGSDEFEATYEEDTHVDPTQQATINASDVKVGIRTINEVREDLGKPPLDEPEADQSMIITATGAVPLSLDDQVEHQKNMTAAMPKPEPAGPGGGKNQKVEKRQRATIDPGHDTPSRRHARGRLEAALVKVFGHQRELAVEKARKLITKVAKAEDDSRKIADEIYSTIEATFLHIAPEARKALEDAALSGASDAWLQVEVTDSDMFAGANRMAADYAATRAAEMIGMKYNSAGELVANPNAKWAISNTTRDRLREIIRNAFEDKTPFSEVIADISEADIFSDERAAMIARTEVARAQVQANLGVWKQVGVEKVRWLAVGPDPCPVCLLNSGKVREIGKRFPSGDDSPLAHPNCYCILQAVLEE